MNTNNKTRTICFRAWSTALFTLLVVFLPTTGKSLTQPEQVLSLEQAVTIALKNNPGFAQQVNNMKSAEVTVSQQRADFYPNLQLEASGSERFDTSQEDSTDSAESRSVTSLNVELSSSINLFNGFADVAALKNSELLLQAEIESLSRSEQTLVFKTISQCIQVLTYQELIHVEEINLEENNELLERIEAFYGAGKIPISDMYQQQAETKQAELDLLEAQHSLKVSKLLLMQIMGMVPTTDYQVSPLDFDILPLMAPDTDTTQLTVLALGNRSDLKAQERQVQAAGQQIREAEAGHLPTVDLSVSLGTDYSGLSDETQFSEQFNDFLDEFADDNLNSTIGITFSVPIFDRSLTRNEIAKARIEKRNEQSLLEEKKLQVGLEIAEALQNYQKTEKQVDVFESKLTYARQALHSYEERYRVGASPLIELTDARNQYVQATFERVQAKYDLVTQEVAVAYYLGNMKQMLATLLQEKS